MMDEKDGRDNDVIRFPQSRVTPGGGNPITVLGFGRMAGIFGVPERQTTGHWCSRCRGVWYGYVLDVDCPVCGNRHG